MFITIRQTQANGKHLFQVESEGRVLYRARTPWADIRAPFQLENLREMTFTDAEGSEVFHAAYNILENTVHGATKYKYLFGASSKLGEYQVVDGDGQVCGAFYTQIDAPFTTQMTIDCGERAYDCYARALGKIYVISVFDGARQIAQITKPLDVWDQLDIFYLHLDDGYGDLLPILSFFTVYVDARQFNRPGQVTAASVEKNWSYSFDQNNDRYDPDWVRRTFGQGAADHLDYLLHKHPERPPADPEQARKHRRLVIGIVAAVAVIVLIAVAAMAWLLRPKTALQAEDFAAQMDGYGYTVTEGTPEGLGSGWELAYEAEKGEYSLWYLSFPTAEAAERFFARTKNQMMAERTGSYLQTSTDLLNSQRYSLTSGGIYSAVSRIDGTVILCTVSEEDKDAVKKTLSDLGY